jgi:dCTP deaminase
MIASAQTIRRLEPLVPLVERQSAFGLTYGLGPAGYDIRIAETLTLMPHEFVIASSIERFEMPDNLLGVVHDKSTWARCGLAVQNTVIEPGFRGFMTIELSNNSSRPIDFKGGMPIAQVIFHLLDKPTDRPYGGKYQDAPCGATPAKFE